jgi:hypothetical protein
VILNGISPCKELPARVRSNKTGSRKELPEEESPDVEYHHRKGRGQYYWLKSAHSKCLTDTYIFSVEKPSAPIIMMHNISNFLQIKTENIVKKDSSEVVKVSLLSLQ